MSLPLDDLNTRLPGPMPGYDNLSGQEDKLESIYLNFRVDQLSLPTAKQVACRARRNKQLCITVRREAYAAS